MTAPVRAGPNAVADLLRRHPVIDGHNDLLWECRVRAGYDFDALGIRSGGASTHTDLPRLRAGGVGAQFWSVYVPADLPGPVTATLEQIDAVHRLVEQYGDTLVLATSADEVEAAWRVGRIASLIGAEGVHSIDCSMGVLRMLFRLGVRYLTLTHNHNVPWADAATDTEVVGGLSPFGREVVGELNRLGMMVDLSHVSTAVMHDALEVSRAPAIFSHSAARALCDHPRNVPDDVLARLPDNGGLCMVTFVPEFVSPDGGSVASLDDVVAHCEHVRAVAGIDHVGLGGDFDGTELLPRGLEDVSRYPDLLEALAVRGWSSEDLARLTCRNLLRVLRRVERCADRLHGVRRPSLARLDDLDRAPDGPPE
jgi:membrane dipeptidase